MRLVRFALLAASLAALPAVVAQGPANRGEIVVSPEARAVHAEALVVDGHNDLPWELRQKAGSSFLLRTMIGS